MSSGRGVWFAASAVIAILAVPGCGSSTSTSTAPSPQVRCALTLGTNNSTLPPEGGSGAISVTAARECTWTVAVEGTWLTLRSSANGQGDGTVEFTAAPNPDPVDRRGALVLNAQRAEITQGAAACVITLETPSASFPPSGGTGRIDVRASSGLCTWTAISDQSWISIRGGTEGKGSAQITFEVEPTAGPPRTGTITVSGQRFNVLQSEGCTYTITPASFNASPNGGQGNVAVTTAPGCPWTASSNVPWLTFAQGSGTGPGPVGFTVTSSPGPARVGTAVIAGQSFTVSQSNGCGYQVQPASHQIGAGGGSASVKVATASGCPWTASSDVPWITVQGAAAQTGEGQVTFTVSATTGPARSGTLTIAGQRVTVTQSQGCTYTINPTQEAIPAAGGSGRVNVTAADGCAWTAATAVAWLRIDSGSSGSGNGTVSYTAAATTGPARSGTLSIAGHTFTVNQGQGCSYTLAPENATVPDAGGTVSFEVRSAAGCAWTAASQAPWITITAGASGSGTGPVQLTVAGNTGPSRSGTVTAGGRSFIVNQGTGCSVTLTPETETAPAGGSSGTVNVATGAGCAWTATSNAPWLSITGPASGTGSGSVAYTAAANTGPARSGTLTISGRTFTVNQGGVCAFTVAPETIAAPAAGGPWRVDVTTSSDCAWTAVSNVPWIVVSAGAAGTGSGAVDIGVAAHTGPARIGTLTIATRTVTVNQESGCTFAINPQAATVAAAGGNASVNVTAGAGCPWTAASQVPWIVITSGSPGSGDGVVAATVEANTTGAPRTGMVIVAGLTFTVTQQ